MTTMTATTCPSWCTHHHPDLEPETHQSATWRAHGLTISIESDDHGADAGICVDHGPLQSLDLTPDEALELGLELIKAEARVRLAHQ